MVMLSPAFLLVSSLGSVTVLGTLTHFSSAPECCKIAHPELCYIVSLCPKIRNISSLQQVKQTKINTDLLISHVEISCNKLLMFVIFGMFAFLVLVYLCMDHGILIHKAECNLNSHSFSSIHISPTDSCLSLIFKVRSWYSKLVPQIQS